MGSDNSSILMAHFDYEFVPIFAEWKKEVKKKNISQKKRMQEIISEDLNKLKNSQ